MRRHEFYLGDGLYASIADGYIWLRAPRAGGDHIIGLDDQTLDAFLAWLGEIRKTLTTKGPPQ